MSELKTKANKKSVAAFVKAVPEPEKRNDTARLVGIFKKITGEKPVMWGTSIIGFGSYHYASERSRQNGDWPLTGFSPRKQNFTVYIMNGLKEYKDLLKKLGHHTVSDGSCIYFKRLSDIHEPVLKTIIKKSIAYMKKKYPKVAG